jgi:hypothetical protein
MRVFELRALSPRPLASLRRARQGFARVFANPLYFKRAFIYGGEAARRDVENLILDTPLWRL